MIHKLWRLEGISQWQREEGMPSGEKSQQLVFQANSASSDQCQWKSHRSISVCVFQFVWEKLQVLVQPRLKDGPQLRQLRQSSGCSFTDTLTLQQPFFAFLKAAGQRVGEGGFLKDIHLAAELRTTTIRQEQLSRGLQAIGFPEFLTWQLVRNGSAAHLICTVLIWFLHWCEVSTTTSFILWPFQSLNNYCCTPQGREGVKEYLNMLWVLIICFGCLLFLN